VVSDAGWVDSANLTLTLNGCELSLSHWSGMSVMHWKRLSVNHWRGLEGEEGDGYQFVVGCFVTRNIGFKVKV